MSNYLQILVQVKSQSSLQPLTKVTILAQAKVLYSETYVKNLKQEFSRAEKIDAEVGDNWHTQRIINRFESRRGSLSNFMQEVKERITHYINKEHNHKGILWEGRFKSPIVENTLEALLAVSTYIDLNPIRAGIVTKPENYRWSGYASALGGNKLAQQGIASLYSHRGNPTKLPGWRKVRADYRQYLFEQGLKVLEDPDSGVKARLGFSAEEVEKEIKRHGKLSMQEVLLHRVRYFTDGAIIGSATFVEEVFQKYRKQLTSPDSRRKTGSRPMRGAEWGNLTTLRDLRLNVIGQPV